jgi:hypothetical protein
LNLRFCYRCALLSPPRDGLHFAQHVRSGTRTGRLQQNDLCALNAGCGAPAPVGETVTVAPSSPLPQHQPQGAVTAAAGEHAHSHVPRDKAS